MLLCLWDLGLRYKHLHGKFVVHPFNGRRIPIVTDGVLVGVAPCPAHLEGLIRTPAWRLFWPFAGQASDARFSLH